MYSICCACKNTLIAFTSYAFCPLSCYYLVTFQTWLVVKKSPKLFNNTLSLTFFYFLCYWHTRSIWNTQQFHSSASGVKMEEKAKKWLENGRERKRENCIIVSHIKINATSYMFL